MFNFPIPEIAWSALMPIILVALTGILALVVELVRPKRSNRLIVQLSVGGLIVGVIAAVGQIGLPPFATGADMIVRDTLASVLQIALMLSTGLTILFSEPYLREKKIPFGEFYPLVLWSAVGAMLMVSTTNLLMVFLGLEILSISLYVMAGMNRSEERSEESALKYFLLGAFASGFLLYGIAMAYGATGGINMLDIGPAWKRDLGMSHTLLIFSLGLMLIGFSFKAGFVPFHQWTPDVYQGAPTNVTSFMASASKIAAIGALWRLMDAASPLKEYWVPVLGTIAVLTMLGGNIMALAQTDLKRVLGYSSIAHAGYMLVAIMAHGVSPTTISSDTVCYYLLSYSLMTVGSFAVISMAARHGREDTSYDDLRGLWRRSPVAAASLLIFVLSLIGIPPLSGFFGKLFIFRDALSAGLGPLALVLAASSIISVSYYLRIAFAAFAADETPASERSTVRLSPGLMTTCLFCAVGVVAIAVLYAPVTSALGLNIGAGLQLGQTGP